MITVGDFLKISDSQVKADGLENLLGEIKLPRRATTGSCGYDFFMPYDITLNPGEDIKIPTYIRAKIMDGWFLMIVPRSSLGFKYKLGLANTAGIIDSDYYYAKNEGHIFVKLVNNGNTVVTINKGEAFCQGIFIPFGVVNGDDAYEHRVGGFGSTNK